MPKPLHRTAFILAAMYLIAVACIVFWPTPVDQQAAGTLHQMFAWLYSRGMPTFIGYNLLEFSANIAMFVPMGFIASTLVKNGWGGIVAGALASCLIELSQAQFLQARYASGLDVLANTMGAATGAAIYCAIKHRRGTTGSADTAAVLVQDSKYSE